tara:strand:- start:5537 stop:6532 length:996 start_codon:yes stop_codon:yes gene_type:complete
MHSTEHPFARFVRILGKGKTGSRSLERHEALEAFGMILRGETEALQLGAFLMLLRVKEESPEEIAGFVEACRECMHAPPDGLRADLDWSSYAGKRHQHPWFILSLLLLAEAGYRIFVHGSAGHTPNRLYTEHAMRSLGLPVASEWAEVEMRLGEAGLCYLPLQCFCPVLDEIIQLKPLLGLRSPVNTLTRMINPLGAPASIQSVFHPAYSRLHQQADLLLGQQRALVFKGESGEVELKPHADTRLHVLENGEMRELIAARAFSQRVAPVDQARVEPLRALWQGDDNDAYGLEATLSTAAAGLLLLRPHSTFTQQRAEAGQLWQQRDRHRLH